MDSIEFKRLINNFRFADVDEKIDMYINSEGLSREQYKELLKLFPLDELHKLEEALG